MTNIIISDQTNFQEIQAKIIADGVENLHIVADFDRTLTKAVVAGIERSSIIMTLRTQNVLGEDYTNKANALFKKYHAIEIDLSVNLEEKKEKMQEWWERHLDLIIESGLTQSDIEKAVKCEGVQFREGVEDFLKFLDAHNIPLVIISANGIGADSIRIFFELKGPFYKNIDIISNAFIWSEDEIAIGYEKPVIHVFNKDETVIHDFPEISNKIENRKNVILLGDSLGDIGMIDGFKYNNLLKIGFLNKNIDENLDIYKKNYDLVLLNDTNFSEINNILTKFD